MNGWLMNKLCLGGEEFVVVHCIFPEGIRVTGVYDRCPCCRKYLDDKRRIAPHYNHCMTCGTPLDENIIRITQLDSLTELHDELRKYEYLLNQKSLDEDTFLEYRRFISKRIVVITKRRVKADAKTKGITD